jgi:ATP-dependent DNA ligase
MTHRPRASPGASYPRGSTAATCPHIPEEHVVHDPETDGYRAQLRCDCGKVTVTARRLRVTHEEARGDAAVLAELYRRNTG